MRRTRRTVLAALAALCALLLVVSAAPASDAPAAAEVPLETVLRAAAFPPLRGLTWSPDGTTLAGVLSETESATNGAASGAGAPRPERVLVAWDGATGAELWRQDLGALTEVRAAATGASLDSPASLSLKSFAFRPDGSGFLLNGASGLFLWSPGETAARRLTPVAPDGSGAEAEIEDPQWSPDGARIAYVRSNDLWVLDVGSGAEARLTSDGADNEILNGKADWVYWEEVWGRDSTGFWWSPDSRSIAFYRFDERAVPTYPLLDESGLQVEIRHQRYPKPGETNPTVSVAVVELATGAVLDLHTGDPADSYLARVHWRPDSRVVAVERLNRAQNRLEMLFCEPGTGICHPVAQQTAETWVNLADDFRFLPDGSFLWSDEASGWRDLARHDGLGRKRTDLLPDDWALDRVDGLVESQGEVIVSAFRRAPLGAATRQILALHLSGTRHPRVLADGPGWSSAEVSEVTGRWVHSHSTATESTRRTLRGLDGSEIATLPGGPELAPELATLPAPAFLEIETAGGARLPAQIVYPAGFDPARKYPVVMFHYGGPASQVVADRWGGRSLWQRWMASRGYVALAVDNEASVFFGKAGEDRLHRRFGELELAGQKAAVAWLAGRGWADTSRLGLWGWSGGGTHTLYALFHSPGTWRAGVAGAPVTDWRLYDSIYTERYFGTPADNPDGYRDSSPLTAAGKLADALLIVHGTADDNVHPQNTIQLLDALVEAGRPVETMFYPGQSHGVRGAASRDFYRRMTEFFDRHLLPAGPAAQP